MKQSKTNICTNNIIAKSNIKTWNEKMNEKNKEINYLSLFLLGCILLSIGVIFTAVINPVFISIMASGICLIAIGVAKRDKGYTLQGNKQE
ncbi:hypothetical protein AC477_03840 [miscellaneous Crenarchaeota group-1 archaeon SG8-32-1]|uniref:Uncharacterized protein n=1 Tax=miscellaneous Crenarchaeota group-1 archaeon SG8-32-1 TaxID=1685124 RepID=A0A0M0BT43_9ARCH|nr:MAG: hypothetical protein AC477_03840 [miscellaneous Crenarchaeota group-1 archaeon SG8-32-1]